MQGNDTVSAFDLRLRPIINKQVASAVNTDKYLERMRLKNMNKWTKWPWWQPGSLHATICFQRPEKAFQRCRKSDSWKLFLNYLSHKEIPQQAKASAALHYSRLTQWHFWHVSCFQIELDLVKLGEHKSEDRVACQTAGRRVTNRHAAVYMWRETPLTFCPKK